MNFKNFQHIILKLQETSKREHEIYKLGVDLTQITDDYQHIITVLLKTYYGEEGEDLISWWLYEDVEKKIYASKGKKVIADLTSMEALWEYIEKIRKSKKFKDYIVKDPMSPEEKNVIIENLFNNLTQKY